MSAEITIKGSVVYDDGSFNTDLTPDSFTDNVAGLKCFKDVQTINITETAINLGGLSNVGWFMLKNLDPTNYVEIKTGTGGVVCGKMMPGKTYGPVYLGSGMQAPYAIANVAACKIAIIAAAQ